MEALMKAMVALLKMLGVNLIATMALWRELKMWVPLHMLFGSMMILSGIMMGCMMAMRRIYKLLRRFSLLILVLTDLVQILLRMMSLRIFFGGDILLEARRKGGVVSPSPYPTSGKDLAQPKFVLKCNGVESANNLVGEPPEVVVPLVAAASSSLVVVPSPTPNVLEVFCEKEIVIVIEIPDSLLG
ncbi:hypothetical protein SUGI_0230480 [Cryptomeria japonica]|nr:hypothetical protein SUGI_0230480 [Cryptomeria japonica]